jgi:uncharacterized protein (DUF488 family)
MNAATLYSIGHSNHSVEQFISLLRSKGIDCLVDVRSTPYSQRLPQFNREAIASDLARVTILYQYKGDCLGGRYTNPSLLTGDGQVDYGKVMQENSFQKGLDELIKLASSGKKVSFMCAEKDPFDCHRFALVSRGLVLKGQHVRHILADGKVIEQADIEKRLLQKYKGDYDQMDLFAGVSSREEALSEAYAMRGKDIAYAGVKNEGW